MVASKKIHHSLPSQILIVGGDYFKLMHTIVQTGSIQGSDPLTYVITIGHDSFRTIVDKHFEFNNSLIIIVCAFWFYVASYFLAFSWTRKVYRWRYTTRFTCSRTVTLIGSTAGSCVVFSNNIYCRFSSQVLIVCSNYFDSVRTISKGGGI